MTSEDVASELEIAARAPRRPRWRLFLAGAVVLYGALYVGAEALVHRYGEKSPLFLIATTPHKSHDIVILGASHAMPLAFEDVNAALEGATDTSILNLSIEGGGIVPNRFMYEAYRAKHEAKTMVYVLDSFAFYSQQWNEERINDPKLLKRAPLDAAILAQLARTPAARDLIPGYVTGFYKINDAGRFKLDVSDKDGPPFARTYRANAVIDRQRLAYLYPKQVDQALYERYLAEFRALAQDIHDQGSKLIVVRTPLPQRVLNNVTGEAEFNARIETILGEFGFVLHDFSQVANEDAGFYDTDHLNKAGVEKFANEYLIPLLRDSTRR